MKIDFNASFEKLQRVVASRATPEVSAPAEFGPLLGSLLNPEQQISVSAASQGRTETPAPFAAPDPMARYNFSEPALTPPRLEPEKPSSPVGPPTPAIPESVKVPTGVDARRVPSSRKMPAQDIEELKELVRGAGRDFGVDPALGKAVVQAESSFNVRAVSADGHASKGLFQLLDSTGKDLKARLDLGGRYDPFNPGMNVHLGVNYLRYLHELFSKDTALPNSLTTIAAANSSSLEKLAVAAFNAGEGRVASAQARAMRAGGDPSEYRAVEPYLPESTREYVARVMQFRDRFSEEKGG